MNHGARRGTPNERRGPDLRPTPMENAWSTKIMAAKETAFSELLIYECVVEGK